MRWGQWEEGIAGTIIKDTWTKSGGLVGGGEGEGRGEKSYNQGCFDGGTESQSTKNKVLKFITIALYLRTLIETEDGCLI